MRDTAIFYIYDQRPVTHEGTTRMQRFPIACVASRIVANVVTFAISIQNPLDAFDRAKARNKALGRLNSINPPSRGQHSFRYVHEHDPEHPESEIKREILQELATKGEIPQRVRRAIKQWLAQPREAHALEPATN